MFFKAFKALFHLITSENKFFIYFFYIKVMKRFGKAQIFTNGSIRNVGRIIVMSSNNSKRKLSNMRDSENNSQNYYLNHINIIKHAI